MLTWKKYSENTDARGRGVVAIKGVSDFPSKGEQVKTRKTTKGQTVRAAFEDITNAAKEQVSDDGKKKTIGPVNPSSKYHTNVICNKSNKRLVNKQRDTQKLQGCQACFFQNSSVSSDSQSTSGFSDQASSVESSIERKSQAARNLASIVPIDRDEEDISFVIIHDDSGTENETNISSKEQESLPSVDLENYTDVFNVGIYAQDIFDYYKLREKLFSIPAYMSSKHCIITPSMRAILVDWLVEIQENFELNHETLYLAVKLTDIYLSRVPVDKDVLQLVGATSVFIASKFDERCPPLIEDFTYICDNAFDRSQFITMEIEVLRTVDFDLGIPISYCFLRRYAKVARMSMETLTLARYILELSLMEYKLITVQDSKLAAAALYIAQKMRKEGVWVGDVVKSSGYLLDDIRDLVVTLNAMLHARPVPQLATIRSKYSHKVFHQVAKIAPLPTQDLFCS